MSLEELLILEEKANKTLLDIQSKIKAFSDGFIYIVVIRSYGSISRIKYSNFISAKNECDEYCGDNGIAEIYSNNPNIAELLGYETVPSKETLKGLSIEEIKEYQEETPKVYSDEELQNILNGEKISKSMGITNLVLQGR